MDQQQCGKVKQIKSQVKIFIIETSKFNIHAFDWGGLKIWEV